MRNARKLRQLLIPGVSPPKVFTKPCFVNIFAGELKLYFEFPSQTASKLRAHFFHTSGMPEPAAQSQCARRRPAAHSKCALRFFRPCPRSSIYAVYKYMSRVCLVYVLFMCTLRCSIVLALYIGPSGACRGPREVLHTFENAAHGGPSARRRRGAAGAGAAMCRVFICMRHLLGPRKAPEVPT